MATNIPRDVVSTIVNAVERNAEGVTLDDIIAGFRDSPGRAKVLRWVKELERADILVIDTTTAPPRYFMTPAAEPFLDSARDRELQPENGASADRSVPQGDRAITGSNDLPPSAALGSGDQRSVGPVNNDAHRADTRTGAAPLGGHDDPSTQPITAPPKSDDAASLPPSSSSAQSVEQQTASALAAATVEWLGRVVPGGLNSTLKTAVAGAVVTALLALFSRISGASWLMPLLSAAAAILLVAIVNRTPKADPTAKDVAKPVAKSEHDAEANAMAKALASSVANMETGTKADSAAAREAKPVANLLAGAVARAAAIARGLGQSRRARYLAVATLLVVMAAWALYVHAHRTDAQASSVAKPATNAMANVVAGDLADARDDALASASATAIANASARTDAAITAKVMANAPTASARIPVAEPLANVAANRRIGVGANGSAASATRPLSHPTASLRTGSVANATDTPPTDSRAARLANRMATGLAKPLVPVNRSLASVAADSPATAATDEPTTPMANVPAASPATRSTAPAAGRVANRPSSNLATVPASSAVKLVASETAAPSADAVTAAPADLEAGALATARTGGAANSLANPRATAKATPATPMTGIQANRAAPALASPPTDPVANVTTTVLAKPSARVAATLPVNPPEAVSPPEAPNTARQTASAAWPAQAMAKTGARPLFGSAEVEQIILRSLTTFSMQPGAYVFFEGGWVALPKNNGRAVRTVAQALNGKFAALNRWEDKIAGKRPDAPPTSLSDKSALPAAQIAFDGRQRVPTVGGKNLTLLFIGPVTPLSADVLARYPDLKTYPLVEIAPLTTLANGMRVAPLVEIAPGLIAFGPYRVDAMIETPVGVTLLRCAGPLAPGHYAFTAGTECFEVNVE